MFTTLVESRGARERRGGGTALSVALHTVLVSLAVYATATASPRAHRDPAEILHFVPQSLRRVAAPPVSRVSIINVPLVSVPRLDLPDVPTTIAAVKAPTIAPDTAFWTRRGLGLTAEPNATTPDRSSNTPYLAVQVDKPAAPVPGSASPSYPAMLREARITGRVVVEFVVDTGGRVEPHSFRILQSDNAMFDDAIRAALPRMRFHPAEAGGHHVRQLVEQPFTFMLNGGD